MPKKKTELEPVPPPPYQGESARRRAQWMLTAGALGAVIGALLGAFIGWTVALSDTRSYLANWEHYVAASGAAALDALASDKAWAMNLGKILPVSLAIGAGTGAGAGALAGWSSLLVQVRVLEAAKL